MQPLQETLSIYEGRTTGFSGEHGVIKTYPEVSDESISQHWFADFAKYQFIVIHKKRIRK